VIVNYRLKQKKRGFAPMNALSAPIAQKVCCEADAQTVAAR